MVLEMVNVHFLQLWRLPQRCHQELHLLAPAVLPVELHMLHAKKQLRECRNDVPAKASATACPIVLSTSTQQASMCCATCMHDDSKFAAMIGAVLRHTGPQPQVNLP